MIAVENPKLYKNSPKSGVSDKVLRRDELTYADYYFILRNMRERVLPSILFLASGVKVKIKSCIT